MTLARTSQKLRWTALVWLGLFGTLVYAADDPFKSAPAPTPTAVATGATSLRVTAIQENSIARGIAEGRQQRFFEIQQYLQANKNTLDTIYQVDHLYMQPRKKKVSTTAGRTTTSMEDDEKFTGFLIQPPIILKAENIMQISDNGRRMENSSVKYAIAANAQFVSSPLYWQTFLIAPEDIQYQGPADDPLSRPKNAEEQTLYKQYYMVGVAEGRAQAEAEFETRTKTLTTMVTGMALGHQVMSRNLLEEPKVNTQNIAVSGNKTQLTLNTDVATIDLPAEFVLDPKKYRSFVHQPNPLRTP